MLYPIMTETRNLFDLSGIWKFYVDDESKRVDVRKPLETNEVMAVPGSFNDQAVFPKIRNHVGNVWYEKDFFVSKNLLDQRIVLRFGSVTHKATVYINGEQVTEHEGGFTPFEVEVNDFIVIGKNRITVKVNNILDNTTLPVGIYEEKKDENGKVIRKMHPNFDFFNYAGIHRPVKIYTTPKNYIKDIIITNNIMKNNAKIIIDVEVEGKYDQLKVIILDKEGNEISYGIGNRTEIIIEKPKLWEPMNSYLYTARIEVYQNNELMDIYEEPFGIRTVKVKNGKFLINDKPFYFKGFGKHEDTYINGRGLNEAANVLDLNLFKWIGANSFRTSHYPYSEEMMRLADQQGIVVIDEVPAVGLFENFGTDLNIEREKVNTWNKMNTKKAHEKVIKELIERDKNHACVVMWSIANEPASHEIGAYEYFEPLIKLAKNLDPQSRPVTTVNIMYATPDKDLVSNLVDIICLNRYYGWYVQTGDLDSAAKTLKNELKAWEEKYPDKPILFTEFGADTLSGFHSIDNIPYTEEYQVNFYKIYHKVFDQFKNIVGEQVWNFADFETDVSIIRIQGNKKGIFNRVREPKMISYILRERWLNIPDFEYKK